MAKTDTLSGGRHKCLKCGRRGVGYANHPHAIGYKDYSRAVCRYCGAYFKIAQAKGESK